MAKPKKPEPELPLFDLPLHPTAAEDHDLPLDVTSADDDSTFGRELEAAAAVAAELPGSAPSEGSEPKGQAMLPDLVVEAPKRGRGSNAPVTPKEVFREPATTPRARLAERRLEDLPSDADEGDLLDDDLALSLAAPLGERALAGLADLGIQLVMLSVAALACHFVGIELSMRLWPPFVGLGLVLSFLYWIIPLAFWGQTPGMAWLGNIARSFDDEPLSFGQALLRWLGAWITAGLLGLPQLLALGGRSLSDRLSDSKTLVLPDDFDD